MKGATEVVEGHNPTAMSELINNSTTSDGTCIGANMHRFSSHGLMQEAGVSNSTLQFGKEHRA